MDSTTEIPSGFRGAATRLTIADIDRTATALGITSRLVEAVAYVESDNHGFLDDGRPALLFEAHQFHILTGGKWDASHPKISSPSWNPSLYGAGGAHQYERLGEAMALDRDAALQAATWGMFQELGLNFKSVGFGSIDALVAAMCDSEGKHIDIFAAHCIAHHLQGYLQSQDLRGFAEKYNGPGQVNYYAAKLLEALKNGNFPPVLPAPTPDPPPAPPPADPPPAPGPDQIRVELRPGQQRVFPEIIGLDQDSNPIAIPPDALSSSDPGVASVSMDGPDDEGQYTATIRWIGAGVATIAGPGVVFSVTAAAAAVLQRIVVDPTKAFTQKIPGVVAAAVLMFAPLGTMAPMVDMRPIEFARPAAPTLIKPAAPALSEGQRLCLSDLSQPVIAIERCLSWVRAQGR